MDFYHFLDIRFGIADSESSIDRYWGEEDETTILMHYSTYLVECQFDCVNPDEFKQYCISDSVVDKFYLELYSHPAYGDGIPFWVCRDFGEEEFFEFMTNFYYTLAMDNGYLSTSQSSSAPTASVVPSISAEPIASVTPSAVVVPPDDLPGVAATLDRTNVLLTSILFVLVFFWLEKKVKNIVRGFFGNGNNG